MIKLNILNILKGILQLSAILNQEQRRMLGRLCHTLCAASIIGFISIVQLSDNLLPENLFRAGSLIFCAIVTLIIGLLAVKGE